jgi:hypothetical protein
MPHPNHIYLRNRRVKVKREVWPLEPQAVTPRLSTLKLKKLDTYVYTFDIQLE